MPKRIHVEYDGHVYLQLEIFPLTDAQAARIVQELQEVVDRVSSEAGPLAALTEAPGGPDSL